jgi:hypothetical protein
VFERFGPGAIATSASPVAVDAHLVVDPGAPEIEGGVFQALLSFLMDLSSVEFLFPGFLCDERIRQDQGNDEAKDHIGSWLRFRRWCGEEDLGELCLLVTGEIGNGVLVQAVEECALRFGEHAAQEADGGN